VNTGALSLMFMASEFVANKKDIQLISHVIFTVNLNEWQGQDR